MSVKFAKSTNQFISVMPSIHSVFVRNVSETQTICTIVTFAGPDGVDPTVDVKVISPGDGYEFEKRSKPIFEVAVTFANGDSEIRGVVAFPEFNEDISCQEIFVRANQERFQFGFGAAAKSAEIVKGKIQSRVVLTKLHGNRLVTELYDNGKLMSIEEKLLTDEEILQEKLKKLGNLSTHDEFTDIEEFVNGNETITIKSSVKGGNLTVEIFENDKLKSKRIEQLDIENKSGRRYVRTVMIENISTERSVNFIATYASSEDDSSTNPIVEKAAVKAGQKVLFPRQQKPLYSLHAAVGPDEHTIVFPTPSTFVDIQELMVDADDGLKIGIVTLEQVGVVKQRQQLPLRKATNLKSLCLKNTSQFQSVDAMVIFAKDNKSDRVSKSHRLTPGSQAQFDANNQYILELSITYNHKGNQVGGAIEMPPGVASDSRLDLQVEADNGAMEIKLMASQSQAQVASAPASQIVEGRIQNRLVKHAIFGNRCVIETFDDAKLVSREEKQMTNEEMMQEKLKKLGAVTVHDEFIDIEEHTDNTGKIVTTKSFMKGGNLTVEIFENGVLKSTKTETLALDVQPGFQYIRTVAVENISSVKSSNVTLKYALDEADAANDPIIEKATIGAGQKLLFPRKPKPAYEIVVSCETNGDIESHNLIFMHPSIIIDIQEVILDLDDGLKLGIVELQHVDLLKHRKQEPLRLATKLRDLKLRNISGQESIDVTCVYAKDTRSNRVTKSHIIAPGQFFLFSKSNDPILEVTANFHRNGVQLGGNIVLPQLDQETENTFMIVRAGTENIEFGLVDDDEEEETRRRVLLAALVEVVRKAPKVDKLWVFNMSLQDSIDVTVTYAVDNKDVAKVTRTATITAGSSFEFEKTTKPVLEAHATFKKGSNFINGKLELPSHLVSENLVTAVRVESSTIRVAVVEEFEAKLLVERALLMREPLVPASKARVLKIRNVSTTQSVNVKVTYADDSRDTPSIKVETVKPRSNCDFKRSVKPIFELSVTFERDGKQFGGVVPLQDNSSDDITVTIDVTEKGLAFAIETEEELIRKTTEAALMFQTKPHRQVSKLERLKVFNLSEAQSIDVKIVFARNSNDAVIVRDKTIKAKETYDFEREGKPALELSITFEHAGKSQGGFIDIPDGDDTELTLFVDVNGMSLKFGFEKEVRSAPVRQATKVRQLTIRNVSKSHLVNAKVSFAIDSHDNAIVRSVAINTDSFHEFTQEMKPLLDVEITFEMNGKRYGGLITLPEITDSDLTVIIDTGAQGLKYGFDTEEDKWRRKEAAAQEAISEPANDLGLHIGSETFEETRVQMAIKTGPLAELKAEVKPFKKASMIRSLLLRNISEATVIEGEVIFATDSDDTEQIKKSQAIASGQIFVFTRTDKPIFSVKVTYTLDGKLLGGTLELPMLNREFERRTLVVSVNVNGMHFGFEDERTEEPIRGKIQKRIVQTRTLGKKQTTEVYDDGKLVSTTEKILSNDELIQDKINKLGSLTTIDEFADVEEHHEQGSVITTKTSVKNGVLKVEVSENGVLKSSRSSKLAIDVGTTTSQFIRTVMAENISNESAVDVKLVYALNEADTKESPIIETACVEAGEKHLFSRHPKPAYELIITRGVEVQSVVFPRPASVIDVQEVMIDVDDGLKVGMVELQHVSFTKRRLEQAFREATRIKSIAMKNSSEIHSMEVVVSYAKDSRSDRVTKSCILTPGESQFFSKSHHPVLELSATFVCGGKRMGGSLALPALEEELETQGVVVKAAETGIQFGFVEAEQVMEGLTVLDPEKITLLEEEPEVQPEKQKVEAGVVMSVAKSTASPASSSQVKVASARATSAGLVAKTSSTTTRTISSAKMITSTTKAKKPATTTIATRTVAITAAATKPATSSTVQTTKSTTTSRFAASSSFKPTTSVTLQSSSSSSSSSQVRSASNPTTTTTISETASSITKHGNQTTNTIVSTKIITAAPKVVTRTVKTFSK
jgi:hypothetical protein